MRIEFSDKLVSLECVECSVTFAFTETVERELRRSQRSFHCPNGHLQNYIGVLEIDRLRAEIDRLNKFIEANEEGMSAKIRRIAQMHEEYKALERSNASLRGTITRLKGRAKR